MKYTQARHSQILFMTSKLNVGFTCFILQPRDQQDMHGAHLYIQHIVKLFLKNNVYSPLLVFFKISVVFFYTPCMI